MTISICDNVHEGVPPSPVVRKEPKWLVAILKKEYPIAKHGGEGVGRALHTFFGERLLDHCGTTDWHGISDCFVSEPYDVDRAALICLCDKARQLGIAVAYDPLAYYHLACHRIVLFPAPAVRCHGEP